MQQACRHCRVLALSSLPREEGMLWLQYGAAAYAHAMSTPDLLQQVFDTVQSGGTWVGRSIMQQLCARFGRQLPAKAADWRSRLSARDRTWCLHCGKAGPTRTLPASWIFPSVR
jgi:DNA-binding NarL/FixJ family response regulator